jgi:hypothetical protein
MNNFNIRKAQRADVPSIIKLLVNDLLGKQRESYQDPLLEQYYTAFTEIDNDKNNYLIVVEDNSKVIGTFQLTIITYLTYQGRLLPSKNGWFLIIKYNTCAACSLIVGINILPQNLGQHCPQYLGSFRLWVGQIVR